MSDAYQTFLPGETPAASRIQDLGEQKLWTPTLQASSSNPTLGSGSTTTGDLLLAAGFVTARFTIQFGSSGTAPGSGTYRVPVPSGFGIDPDWQDNIAIGTVWASDSSAGAAGFYFFFARTSSSNPDTFVFGTTVPSAGGSPVSSAVTNSVPFAWGANDYLRGSVRYKTDFT